MRHLLFLVLLTVACTDEENSVRALKAHGFVNIRTIGYTWFECGKDDTFHTGFEATNANGQRVKGTVCCGFLGKGCTIRF